MELLAQAASKKDAPIGVLLWLGALVLVTLAGGLVILWLRKRMLAKEDGSEGGASIMDSLREMRDRGEISQDEYAAMRQSMARQMRSSIDAGRKAGSAPRGKPASQSGVREGGRMGGERGSGAGGALGDGSLPSDG